jgi:hypothetical protein
MKTHNDLKELLEAYDDYNVPEARKKGMSNADIIIDFLASNSLALGKPEPLAKNKQLGIVCPICGGSGKLNQDNYATVIVDDTCFNCKGTGSIGQITIATSR